MALIGINQISRAPKESTLDKIAKGLNIANSVLGVSLAIPEYMQKKELANLDKAKTTTDIAQNTEAAQPGEQGSFEVPGLGVRKPGPNLGKEVQKLNIENTQGDIAEENRKRQPLGEEGKKSYIMMLKSAGVNQISPEMIPTTVGQFEDAIKARLSAIQVTPQQSREFEYKKTEDQKKEEQDKAGRFVPQLKQHAATLDDAKEIKTALANKSAIEKQVDQMIALRNKHPGGTLDPRDSEDIARAQQLSTQALLKYKNLSQLGVLSRTDMELIDKIFPSNPLEVNPSGLLGQDPTMAKLKQLKENLNGDFNMYLEIKGLTPQDFSIQPPTADQAKGF